MKTKRDLHRHVRVVYRACRKKYGKEKAQDECLEVFKVVYPFLVELRQSDEPYATIPYEVMEGIDEVADGWKPEGRLQELIERVKEELSISSLLETRREHVIELCEDILPVVMRIRKLTPRECFRLMDVEEEDIDTIQQTGVSNSAQYKLAGNSIVVACLYHIFKNLFVERQEEANKNPIELNLFDL